MLVPVKGVFMQAPHLTHSKTLVLLIGAVFVTVATFVAFSYLDWLCITLIVLISMTLTVRMELNGGQAIANS